MNPHSDNELDFLFKDKLTTAKSEFDFLEEEWESMEDILSPQPRKKNRVIWIYRISAGIAASLLLGWCFQFVYNTPVKPTGNKIAKVERYRSEIAHTHNNHHLKDGQQNVTAPHQGMGLNTFFHRIAKQNHHTLVENVSLNTAFTDRTHRSDVALQAVSLPAENKEPYFDEPLTKTLSMAPVNIDSAKGTIAVAGNKKPTKPHTVTGPRLALAVLAAPDMNGVSSFHNEQTGLNFTAQLSLKLTNKLSISTGAAYAIKPYQTDFGNYKTASPGWGAAMWTSNAKPNIVTANCYVLDIPLNINYQLYNRGSNSFTIGTGLSSYIMLKEDYRFSFPDPAKDAVNVDIDNQNRHLLGVLNMNVNYQHQLNNKLGIILQPYLKLPLTQIGFGQVDLQSAGIAVGFNWNIK